jgi:hypothetical protein
VCANFVYDGTIFRLTRYLFVSDICMVGSSRLRLLIGVILVCWVAELSHDRGLEACDVTDSVQLFLFANVTKCTPCPLTCGAPTTCALGALSFLLLFRGLVPLVRVCVWCLCGWLWGPSLFWILLCVVVAVLCFGWFLLQCGASASSVFCVGMCLLGRLPACAFWFPACFPPSFALPPFCVSL